MITPAEEEFISSFHSLKGITIGEQKKSLFLLLNATSEALKASGWEIDVSRLHPKSPLEESFKVNVLIYFKKISELKEVLKSGNPMLIEKVLNVGSWFIEEAFDDVTGKELVDDIFPYLSYNAKLKLLHKLGLYLKDANKAEEYFESVKENYGLHISSKLLMACSGDFILKTIDVNRIEITPRQLLIIVEKHPELTERIFEKLSQYCGKSCISYKYKLVYKYLSHHHVKLFVKIKEKYGLYIYVGSRSTMRFIKEMKEDILNDPNKFSFFLKKKRLLKNMQQDFDRFYLNYFPKSLKEFNCSDWLENLNMSKRFSSNEKRLHFFLDTFRKVYGTELWDHPQLVSSILIEMMSLDARVIWMDDHTRPENIPVDQWISFMKIEKSVPLLKERIGYTSKIKERVRLSGYLIKTCKINNDEKALVEVLEYFIIKHKNDHVTVRDEIIRSLYKHFDLWKLTEEHWKYINEFITLSRLNNEHSWVHVKVMEKYIHYSLENKLPIKELLVQFVQLANADYNILSEIPEYEKKCLLMFNETFPSAYKKEDLQDRYITYLNCICSWNERHPKDKISLFINPEAIETLKLKLRDAYIYAELRIAAIFVKFDFEKAEETNLIESLLKSESCYFKINIINKLIRNHPQTFMKYIKIITEDIIRSSHICLTFSKSLRRYYAHFDTLRYLSDYFMNLLCNQNIDEKKYAARILSVAMQPVDFLNLVASNYPLNLSVDIVSPEGQNTYKLQQALLPFLKNIIPPSLALDAVLQFCKGDYLSLIQSSLYSVSLNVPENRLVPFFVVLNERAVSVRKHSIFLAFKVLQKRNVYDMLNNFMENEKNHSIHKSLFKGIFNFFIRNPDDYSWGLTKLSVEKIDAKDKEAFNILSKYKRIPPAYFVEYVLFTFNYLENSEDNDIIEKGKCRLLESINCNNISELPKHFCHKIIEEYFFNTKQPQSIQLKAYYFVSKFILYYSDDHEELMIPVFAKLKNSISSSGYNNQGCYKNCSKFIKEFCSDFIENDCDNKEIVKTFIKLWNGIFKPFQAFNDYLYLNFTLIYVELLQDKISIEEVGKKITALCDTLHNQESIIVHIFYQCFKIFEDKILSSCFEEDKEENLFILLESILEASSTRSSLMLVICLLPKDDVTTPKIKCKYNEIIEALVKKDDNFLQICLCDHFNEKE